MQLQSGLKALFASVAVGVTAPLIGHGWPKGIINKVVQVNLLEMQFADYLLKDHAHTHNITDYRNREGQSIMGRLSILKSVLRGETLFS